MICPCTQIFAFVIPLANIAFAFHWVQTVHNDLPLSLAFAISFRHLPLSLSTPYSQWRRQMVKANFWKRSVKNVSEYLKNL